MARESETTEVGGLLLRKKGTSLDRSHVILIPLLYIYVHHSVTSTSSTMSTSPSDDGQQQDSNVIMKKASSSLTALSILVSKNPASLFIGSVDSGSRRVTQADDDLLLEAETALALSTEKGGKGGEHGLGVMGERSGSGEAGNLLHDEKPGSGSSSACSTTSSRDGETESPLEVSADAIGPFELDELDTI